MKKCNKCKITKKLSDFSKNKSKKDGLNYWCKECQYEATRKWRAENYDKVKIQRERWKKENPDYGKNRYMSNRKHILNITKTYKRNNKNKLAEYSKKYYKQNKDKILKYRNEYRKNRRKIDPTYRLSLNLRTRLWHAINGNIKKGSAIKDLGCSVKELKKYLEILFYVHPKTGEFMKWNNYGNGWHVDHVIPLSLFDLTNINQFLEACHYTNLQPLWAEENLRKSNRR